MRIMIVPLVVALIITHYLTTPPEPRSLFTSLLEQNANSNTNHRLLADISAYEVNALNKIGYSSWISNSVPHHLKIDISCLPISGRFIWRVRTDVLLQLFTVSFPNPLRQFHLLPLLRSLVHR